MSTMPEASEANVGLVYYYTGDSTAQFKTNHCYQCKEEVDKESGIKDYI